MGLRPPRQQVRPSQLPEPPHWRGASPQAVQDSPGVCECSRSHVFPVGCRACSSKRNPLGPVVPVTGTRNFIHPWLPSWGVAGTAERRPGSRSLHSGFLDDSRLRVAAFFCKPPLLFCFVVAFVCHCGFFVAASRVLQFDPKAPQPPPAPGWAQRLPCGSDHKEGGSFVRGLGRAPDTTPNQGEKVRYLHPGRRLRDRRPVKGVALFVFVVGLREKSARRDSQPRGGGEVPPSRWETARPAPWERCLFSFVFCVGGLGIGGLGGKEQKTSGSERKQTR